jgi:hypothetical protein
VITVTQPKSCAFKVDVVVTESNDRTSGTRILHAQIWAVLARIGLPASVSQNGRHALTHAIRRRALGAPAMFVVANFGYGGEGPVSQQGPALPACDAGVAQASGDHTGTVFYVNRNGSRSRGGFVPDLLCGRHGLWMDRRNDSVGRRRKKPQNSCSPSTGALSGATLIRFRFLV